MRLGVFERTLGGLEAVLGPPIRELTRDLFSRRLSADEERARIDQTQTALENVRRTEAALEDQASSLVAYGDYIVRQVQAARDLSRRISAADIQRYVVDYLGQQYPGCDLLQDPDDPAVVAINLTAAAKNDLAAFLRERRAAQGTALSRNAPTPGPVPIREQTPRIPSARRRDRLPVSSARTLRRGFGGKGPSHSLSCGGREDWAGQGADQACSSGDYLVAVMRWSFEALRSSEQLWFGAHSARRTRRTAHRRGRRAARHGRRERRHSVARRLFRARLSRPRRGRRAEAAEARRRGVRHIRSKTPGPERRPGRRPAAEPRRAPVASAAQVPRSCARASSNEGTWASLRYRLATSSGSQRGSSGSGFASTQRRQLRASFDDVSVGIVRVE